MGHASGAQIPPITPRACAARSIGWWVCRAPNGGFAAFDADNTSYYLNKIPFADHGALLDPPTSDVTARVVTVLARIGRPQDRPALNRALEYLRAQQEPDGSWFGRWGTNYIYGTWSVLTALAQAGVGAAGCRRAPRGRVAASRQNPDGGWGESNDSYAKGQRSERKCASTPYQTAWAVLALLASGEAGSDAVRRGVNHLMRTQQADGLWSDPQFHRAGVPARVLSQVSRLQRLFPAVGARRIPNVDSGRDRSLNVAGVVAALAAEARALGPAARGGGSSGARGRHAGLQSAESVAAAAARAALGLIEAGATSAGQLGDGGRPRSRARGWSRLLAERSHRRRMAPASSPPGTGASRWLRSSPRTGRWSAASFSPAPRRSTRWRRNRPPIERPVPLPSTWRALPSRKWPRLTACPSSPCV